MKRKIAMMGIGACLTAGGLAAVAQDATAGPPNQGVDKYGFCKPVYIGNADCWHESAVSYKTKSACVSAMKYWNLGASNQNVPTASCFAVPPNGYYRLQVYSSACKAYETLQACRKRGKI